MGWRSRIRICRRLFYFWPEVPEQPDHLNVDLVSFPSHSVHQNRSIVSLRSEREFVEWKRKCKDRDLTTPMLPPTRPVSHLNIQDPSSIWCTTKCSQSKEIKCMYISHCTCIHCPPCRGNNSQSCLDENCLNGCNHRWSTSGVKDFHKKCFRWKVKKKCNITN